MMPRGTKLDIPILPSSVDIITMIQRDIKPGILILLYLVVITITTLLGKRPVQAIPLSSGDIRTILLQAVVILQPVYMDHMTVLKCGRFAASGIILWQILLRVECLLSSIMQPARL